MAQTKQTPWLDLLWLFLKEVHIQACSRYERALVDALEEKAAIIDEDFGIQNQYSG